MKILSVGLRVSAGGFLALALAASNAAAQE